MKFLIGDSTVVAPPSLGLSNSAQIMVMVLCGFGAVFLLRLLRRRQLRGKYTLLWIVTGFVVLLIGAFPGMIDRASEALDIYNPPNMLFLLAIAFLALVCVYFSYELTRLEERTRILAEELAILRGDLQEQMIPGVSVDAREASGETERPS